MLVTPWPNGCTRLSWGSPEPTASCQRCGSFSESRSTAAREAAETSNTGPYPSPRTAPAHLVLHGCGALRGDPHVSYTASCRIAAASPRPRRPPRRQAAPFICISPLPLASLGDKVGPPRPRPLPGRSSPPRGVPAAVCAARGGCWRGGVEGSGVRSAALGGTAARFRAGGTQGPSQGEGWRPCFLSPSGSARALSKQLTSRSGHETGHWGQKTFCLPPPPRLLPPSLGGFLGLSRFKAPRLPVKAPLGRVALK